jgi:tRNA (cytidine/uridine-2'-O-)-methyltransferase
VIDVVLVAPEIAGNTGNIIRLCANTGSRLHLVRPLGFTLEDSQLKRAGLDYHEYTPLHVHDSLPHALQFIADESNRPVNGLSLYAMSSHASTRYVDVQFTGQEVLIFGCERSGLSSDELGSIPNAQLLLIPMQPHNRSLNLANSVAIIVYEAWRQMQFIGAAETLSPIEGHGTTTELLGGPPFDH